MIELKPARPHVGVPKDLAGLALAALLAMTLATPTALECLATAPQHQPSVNAFRFKVFALKASEIPGLVGAKVGSLHLAVPINGALIPGYVFILPRTVVKTVLSDTNRTAYIPVIGEDVVKPDDILVAVVPQPTAPGSPSVRGVLKIFSPEAGASVRSLRAWGLAYAEMGLHLRAGVVIRAGSPAVDLASGRVSRLRGGAGFILYFDRRASYQTLPADVGLLNALLKAVGAGKALGEGLSPACLKALRKALATLAREEGVRSLGMQTLAAGEGVSSRYYRFTAVLARNAVLGRALSKALYIGPYVLNAGLMLRAESATRSPACVEVRVTLWRVRLSEVPGGVVREGVVSTYDGYYLIGESPTNIAVYPLTNRTSSKLQAEVEVRAVYGSVKVLLAAFWVDKKYPSMPIPETREGVQILSTGIAALGNRSAGTVPAPLRPARASQHIRAGTSSGLGLQWRAPLNVSFSYGLMNGVYVDSGSPTYMYVDLCVRNAGNVARDGSIRLYVNGLLVGGRDLMLKPHSFSHADFKIPVTELLAPFRWGCGGLVTVVTDFKTHDVRVYADAVAAFKYAPGVWDPGDMNSWSSNPSAAGEVLLYQSSRSSVLFKTAIVVRSAYVKVVQNNRIAVLERVLAASGRVFRGIALNVRMSRRFFQSLSSYSCFAKASGLESLGSWWLEPTAAIDSLVSAGAEAALLAGVAVPKWVGVSVIIAGVAADAFKAAEPGVRVFKTVSGDYVALHACWSPGWGGSGRWVELELYLGVTRGSVGLRTLWVSTNLWGTWVLKPTAVKVVVVSPYLVEGELIEPPGISNTGLGGGGAWWVEGGQG